MDIKLDEKEKTAEVIPEADLISGEVQSFKTDILNLIDHNFKEININLKNVEMIDSFGVGAILSIHKSMLKSGGKIRLSNVCSDILEMFYLINLDKHFEIKGRKPQ